MAINIVGTVNNTQITVRSVGRSSDLEIIPDDRQTLVQTVGTTGTASVTVEDYGTVDNGEVVSLSATFLPTDYTNLVTFWKNRTPVTVTFDDTSTITNGRVLIRRVQYYDELMPTRKTVQLEVWRI